MRSITINDSSTASYPAVFGTDTPQSIAAGLAQQVNVQAASVPLPGVSAIAVGAVVEVQAPSGTSLTKGQASGITLSIGTALSSKGDSRLSYINYPNNQSSSFKYYPTTYDERLQEILNVNPSGNGLSQFDYSYDSAGQITNWLQQQQNSHLNYLNGYDQAGQLSSAVAGNGGSVQPYLNQFNYNYDKAANRTTAQQSVGQIATIAGTGANSDQIVATVTDPALPSGSLAVTYTMTGTPTPTTMAQNLAALITSNSTLQTYGIYATPYGSSGINLRSKSGSFTSFSVTLPVTNTGTETVVLGGSNTENFTLTGTITPGDTVSITVYDPNLSTNPSTVSQVATGLNFRTLAQDLATKLNGLSNNNINIAATYNSGGATTIGTITAVVTSPNVTTFSTPGGQTEVVTFGPSLNGNVTGVVGTNTSGNPTTGDIVTLTVLDKGLPSGQVNISYTVASTLLSDIANGLANGNGMGVGGINNNTSLQQIGVTATPSSNFITISSCSTNATSYIPYTSNSGLSAPGTETLVLALPTNGTEAATVASPAAGDVINLTIFDNSISLGSHTFQVTVPGSPTPSGVATLIASAIGTTYPGITANAVMGVVNITSTTPYTTSYASSITGSGGTTLTLGPTTSAAQSVYNNVNELTNVIPGGAVRFTGTSSQALSSASITTSVVGLNVYPSTYGESVTGAQSETLALGQYNNGTQAVTIGGSATAGDGLAITFYNAALSGGMHTNTYTVPTGTPPSTSAMAAALASQINSDSTLQKIGIVAANTTGSSVVTISVSPTTYSVSTAGGASETLTQGTNINGNSTVSVGGTASSGGSVTITVNNSVALSGVGGSIAKTYNVTGTPTLPSVAAGLVAAISGDTTLQALGVSASNSAAPNLNSTMSFSGTGGLAAGPNTAALAGTNGDSMTTTNLYQVPVPAISSQSLTFDANGNMTSNGTNSYSYDAENRLVQITYPGTGNSTQFTFDGMGRCEQLVESGSTPAYSGNATKQFVWCGNILCEERNSGSVVKQFFGLGEVISGAPYFYTRDHLGNIRELTNGSGAVQMEYNYDPFGRVTQTQIASGMSIPPSDFQYAGMYEHGRSGLNLTKYRAYSSNLARWISRDPIDEAGGVNLYGYVLNNPFSNIDALGLDVIVLYDPNAEWEGIRTGHCAILVGKDKVQGQAGGWTYWSMGQDDVDRGLTSMSLNAFYTNGPEYTPKNSAWFDTNTTQDENARQSALDSINKGYKKFTNNCADLCRNAAKAADIPIRNKLGIDTPLGVFNDAKAAGGVPPTVGK